MPTEEFFDTRLAASEAAATIVADGIRHSLEEAPRTGIVVSGGSTPAQCFQILADSALEWDRVSIVPSDERCVAEDHEQRNEAMLRRSLMINRARHAKLVSIYDETLSHEAQGNALSEKLESLPLPLPVVLLGMGEDGHFASLFPDSEQLTEGLDPDTERRYLFIRTAASANARVTLTMSMLLQCKEIVLLFFGSTKRDVYEKAKSPDSDYPVSRLLQQERTPVRAIWAP